MCLVTVTTQYTAKDNVKKDILMSRKGILTVQRSHTAMDYATGDVILRTDDLFGRWFDYVQSITKGIRLSLTNGC